MEVLLSPEGLLSLLTLTFLEIVLGIDNIIFISLISNDLEAAQQPLARVIISMVIMLVFARPIAEFIERHMSLQILALAFLIMIGTVLIAESAHIEIPKPYIYCSVGFALMVQLLSIRAAERNK